MDERTPLLPTDAAAEIAEGYPDYRFFSRLTRLTAIVTLVGLFYIAWYVLWYVFWDRAVTPGAFLLTTVLIFTVVSFCSGLVAYALYKRRGGRVVKNEPPLGVVEQRKHFGP